MYRLTVRETFDAAHFLPDHPGKCSQMHGHTWVVEVEVSARELGNAGMVVDFADIKNVLRTVLSMFDHRVLNEMPSFTVTAPTAENVAGVILGQMSAQIRGVSAVTVWETPTAAVRLEA